MFEVVFDLTFTSRVEGARMKTGLVIRTGSKRLPEGEYCTTLCMYVHLIRLMTVSPDLFFLDPNITLFNNNYYKYIWIRMKLRRGRDTWMDAFDAAWLDNDRK